MTEEEEERIERFISACRFAGPDGIQQLRLEAWALYQILKERKSVSTVNMISAISS